MVIDEIDTVAPGATANLSLYLDADNYVLICNMVGPAGAHYSLGMRAAFVVQ